MSGISHTSVGDVLYGTEYDALDAHDFAHGTEFPGAPSERQFYYRDDLNKLYYYNGTEWLPAGKPWGDVEADAVAATTGSGGYMDYTAINGEIGVEVEILADTITPSKPDATVCAFAGILCAPYDDIATDQWTIRLYINEVLVDSEAVVDDPEHVTVCLTGFQDGLPAESIDISLRAIRTGGGSGDLNKLLYKLTDSLAAIAVIN